MPLIVLSYRRDDARAVTGRIFDRLVNEYGKKNVFMDVDTIPASENFRDHLHDALHRCDIMLAIIGPRWRGGGRGKYGRLGKADDFVRIEIETALRRDVRIIPVLVDKTPMPGPERLPRAIAELASRQAVSLDSGERFHSDMDRLIEAIGQRLELTRDIREIRRHFLSAPPAEELVRAKYELDAYLAENPHDVEARILLSQIAHAIDYEFRAKTIRRYGPGAPLATKSGGAGPIGAALMIVAATALYFFADRYLGAPSVLQGFALQQDTSIEGAELNRNAPVKAVTRVSQCAQTCRADDDCAGFSFGKAMDVYDRHACLLYRAPVRPVKNDRWISGLRR